MDLTIDQALLQAIQAHRSGNLPEAERLYRAILQVQPKHPDANHNLGVLAVGVGKPEEGLPFLKAALDANPEQGQFWVSYIEALIQADRLPQAKEILEAGKRLGLPGEAVGQLERKLGTPPSETLSSPNQPGRTKKPAKSRKPSSKSKRPSAPLQSLPGLSLQDAQPLLDCYAVGDWSRAEELALALTKKFPNDAFGWKALGSVFQQTGRLEEALRAKTKAVELNPDEAEAHFNLGNTLKDLGGLAQAAACYREAIRLEPNYADAHSNLGVALSQLGRWTEAEASYRDAVRLKPGDAEFRSNLLFGLNYVESVSPEAGLEEAKSFGSMVSARAMPKFAARTEEKDPARLRVGFVSGDLNNHPVGYFVEGLIAQLDPGLFELYAFPTITKEDDLSGRIRPFFQEWVPLFGRSDLDAAATIRQRGIHVLIDLSGHTASNRLPVFAYRPAPVQASWLGYFATTGLPEMDYFLGDPYMAPEGEQRYFTEKILNLPETWLCRTPPVQEVPVSPLPAMENGHVTFGCFGNLSKMNDDVVNLWAAILQRVPSAKLFLKSKQLTEVQTRAETMARFAGHGISSDRIILEGPSSQTDYLKSYGRSDMVLDTFPYPGGTTSTDALWMGVPVLTLRGDRFLSRLGESIAHNAGQSDWIARDPGDYVEKAVRFSSDPSALMDIRANLRERVRRTPLFDAPRFAKNFGDSLWDMWRRRPRASAG